MNDYEIRQLEAEIIDLNGMVEVRDFFLDQMQQDAVELDEILAHQDSLLTAASELLWSLDYDPMAGVRALLNDASDNSTVVSKAKLQAVLDNFSPVRQAAIK